MTKRGGGAAAGPAPAGGEVIPIDRLRLSAGNPRRHTDRNRAAAAASVAAFGLARSVVIDGDGVVRAGNLTAEAALAAGFTHARVIDATGDELIVVRRADWTPALAEAYEVTDNRVAELAGWDHTKLADKLRAAESGGPGAAALGYDPAERDAVYEAVQADRITGAIARLAAGPGDDGDDRAGGPDAAAAPTGTAAGYRPFTVVLTEAQHDAVMAAVKRVKAGGSADTTPAALAFIAERYLELDP